MFFLFPFGLLWFFIFIFFGARIISGFFRDHYYNDRRSIGRSINRRLSDNNIRDIFSSGYRIRNPVNAEHKIFRLADKLRGKLTVSDIVIHTGLGIKEAEDTMNAMVDGIRVKMEVDDRGIVVYEFPEIIARYEGGSL